jgi:uncharacterized membrane protein YciS (DUF1049 family)
MLNANSKLLLINYKDHSLKARTSLKLLIKLLYLKLKLRIVKESRKFKKANNN